VLFRSLLKLQESLYPRPEIGHDGEAIGDLILTDHLLEGRHIYTEHFGDSFVHISAAVRCYFRIEKLSTI